MEIQQPTSELDPSEYVASVSNLDGTLTISPTTGDVIASLNLGNANTWSAQQDNTSYFRNNSNIDYYGGGGGANDIIVAAGGENAISGWIGLLYNSSTLSLNAQTEDGNLVAFKAQSVQADSYSGTWNGNTIDQIYGGTGATSYGANRIIYQNSGNTAFTSLSTFTFDGTNLGLGTASASAKLHIVKTTEQLRLGYDASNYVTQTVSSAGNLTRNITGTAISDTLNSNQGLYQGYTSSAMFASIGGTGRLGGGFGKLNLEGTSNASDSPTLIIQNTSNTSTGKNGGIWGKTRMTSRYLQTIQNLGFNDNSFGNPGVIQWTAWEYSNAAYTTLVAPTEFTGWSYQYYNGSSYVNLLRIHTSGVFVGAASAAVAPATVFQANNRTVAAGTPGTLATVTISRALNSGVSYPQAASFNIGTYSTNSIGNGYGPDTRLDLALKSTSTDNYTTNVNVMTWLDTGSVGIDETNPTARLQIKSSTSGTGSNAFRIQSAGSADRLVYRDDGRLWLGTGTASYNGLLTLNSSSTQTEIQFTTAASGVTSTDGFYLQYTDAVGARYLLMENQPHVFYISGTEVARFSNTGAIMQVTGTLAAQYTGAGSSRGGTISLVSSAGTPQDWYMAVAGNDNSVVNGRSWFLYDNTNSVARFFVNTSGDVGIGLGSNAAAARLHLISTSTPHIRFGQTTSIYCDVAIAGTTGVVTFDSVGGSTPSFVFSDAVTINGSLTLSAQNIITDTTTGMKIGTGTTQKIGLWNTTPDVQPTTAITAAAFVANTSGIADDTATFGGYTMGQIVAALKRLGALA